MTNTFGRIACRCAVTIVVVLKLALLVLVVVFIGGNHGEAAILSLGPGRAEDINNAGQVVGTNDQITNITAFLWDAVNGKQQIFDGIAYAINESGIVAGTSSSGDAVVWDEVNGLTTIASSANATDINDNGEVVGNLFDGKAFRWDSTNGITTIPIDEVWSINNSGVVVGRNYGTNRSTAIRWNTDGTIETIESLIGETLPSGSRAHSINDLGQIVVSPFGGAYEGFLYDPVDGKLGLGDLPGGGFNTHGYGLSENGFVTGSSRGVLGNEAFIWDKDNGMVGLGFLAGGSGSFGIAVNDAGVVVGVSGSPNVEHAVVWGDNLIPEPTSAALALVAALLVSAFNRRRKSGVEIHDKYFN